MERLEMEVAMDLSLVFSSQPIHNVDKMTLLRCNPRKFPLVQKAIDDLGELSAKAQGLKRVLTTYDKLVATEDAQSLYIMWHVHPEKPQTSVIVGLLKVARKKLYLVDTSGRRKFEESPLCVLDFYVCESEQRKGNGHELFEYMLSSNGVCAWQLGIDRPSDAFLQFLAKHYQLTNSVWQATNFVVFAEFFQDKKTTTREDGDERRGARSDKATPLQSPRNVQTPSSRSSSKDSAGGIIHGTSGLPGRFLPGPDTPTGRKNKRDFGHQALW